MKLPIKQFMIIYLASLLVLSALMLGQPMRTAIGATIVFIYVIVDYLLKLINSRSQSTPYTLPPTPWQFISSSSIISALIISLVFDTFSHPWLAILAAVIAALSKKFVRFGRIHHLINPAALAMVVISFFVPVVSWWSASWSIFPLVMIVICGAYIVYKIRRFRLVISFLLAYGFAITILTILRGGADLLPALLPAALTDASFLFFATVMLVEPITSTFSKQISQIRFGALIGIVAVLIGSYSFFRSQDPLLFALVIGNIIVSLRTLPSVVKKLETSN